MTVAGASPTIRQRELGKRLRNLRNEQGKTVEEVAEELMCSPAKISRLETAVRKPVPRDVRDLCRIYGVKEPDASELMKLTKEALEPGWWNQYDDLGLNPYIGLEQEATSITSYCLLYLHGLVQTEDYASTIIKAIAPKISPEVLHQRVEARIRRQERLESADVPRYRLLLDETALLRPMGGPAVMAAQIAKLLKLASEEKVTPQVVPLSAGAYSVADIGFTLLEFPEGTVSPVVFLESLTAHQYYERTVDVARYRESLEYIRDSALSPRDSLQRLTELHKTYADG